MVTLHVLFPIWALICFLLLRHFEDRSIRSKKSSLMSQHGLSFMGFMERQRTAFPSKFSYVFAMLPTLSTGPMESCTAAQNLRVHRFGDCKPQFAWAEEVPSTSLFVHWDINHAPMAFSSPQHLCSHWWATDSVSAIPSMQQQELACPSKSLCWHQVQYLGCNS